MIRLYRRRAKIPANWKKVVGRSLSDVAAYQQEAARFERLHINSDARRKGFVEFAGHVLVTRRGKACFPACWSIAKEALAEMSRHKCSYCEGEINSPRAGQVEHFHPKSLFPSLAYVWSNYFLACGGCNGAKSDKWPKAGTYLRPDKGNPSAHLVFGSDGTVRPKQRRSAARRTIIDFDLNRTWLVRLRRKHIRLMMEQLELIGEVTKADTKVAARLARKAQRRFASPELTYSAALRQCFSSVWKNVYPGVRLSSKRR